jgi:hypothetical protein
MVGALVLRQVLRQLALGLTIGVCLTYVFDRMFITSPIRPIDLPSLLPTVASIIVVGVAACLAPALRAVSIDPAFSLRDE